MSEEDSEDGEPEDSPDTRKNKDNSTSKEESTENQTNSNVSDTESSGTVQLSVRSLMIGIFVMGLAIGFSGGVLTSSGTDLLDTGTVGNAGPDSPTQPSDSGNNDQQGETETINMDEIEMEGEPVLGQADAPVTMVIYEDFECPFCKRFEEGAFPQIKSNYVDSGQVKVVWKDRPLSQLHPWAEPAAAAMECVYREGGDEAFWNVKQKIFANQDSIETSNVESNIKSWAAEEGVSESAVQSCIDNDNPMDEVNEDFRQGSNLGIKGTPTAVIDGQKIVGAQPYGNFESAIEEALNG